MCVIGAYVHILRRQLGFHRTPDEPARTHDVTTAHATQTSDDPSRPGFSHFLNKHRFTLRRLHSLAGILFGGYVVVHLLVNATLLEAAFPSIFGARTDVYQQQVDKIHQLPFLVALEWGAIYLPLLFHAIYGTLIAFSGRINVDRYSYGKNWAYTAQRITSFVLLAFLAFHVLTMKGVFVGPFADKLTFAPQNFSTITTVNHMHAAWWVGWVVYPIGILAATFHLSNGFWTAGVTWGLIITARAQRLWGIACVGLFAFTTFCGFAALGSALATDPVDSAVIKRAQEYYKDPAVGAGLSPSSAIQQASEAIKNIAGVEDDETADVTDSE